MSNATFSRWWHWLVPEHLWRCRIVGMLIGCALTLIGGTATWWITKPETPWFEFHELKADYNLTRNQIDLTGTYHLDRLCKNPEQYMVLRSEVIDKRYQVLSAIIPLEQLALEVGSHDYEDTIELSRPLADPTRAHVRVTALCGGEFPPTVSPPTLVEVRRP